ncbi:MAG: hypothetical protein QOD72_1264 [Acidimicrobiaceae bacterium]|nr:hypothetical protein [Acidimicrobiaceae bacterium]
MTITFDTGGGAAVGAGADDTDVVTGTVVVVGAALVVVGAALVVVAAGLVAGVSLADRAASWPPHAANGAATKRASASRAALRRGVKADMS